MELNIHQVSARFFHGAEPGKNYEYLEYRNNKSGGPAYSLYVFHHGIIDLLESILQTEEERTKFAEVVHHVGLDGSEMTRALVYMSGVYEDGFPAVGRALDYLVEFSVRRVSFHDLQLMHDIVQSVPRPEL